MTMSHTPGPWVCEPVTDGIGIRARGPAVSGYVAIVGTNWGHDDQIREQQANALLISAAPDLLAACEKAKKFLVPDLVEPGRTVFWELVFAIRKANGET